MLAIHTPTSIGWTQTPASQGVSPQPVSGTAAVRKVVRDPQAGGDGGRPASLPRPDKRQAAAGQEAPVTPGQDGAEADTAAPLLPRPRSPEQERQARAEDARKKAEEEETDRVEDTQAQAGPRQVPPQELLSNIWQASAGVVEQALGDGVAADTDMARVAQDSGTPEREVVSYDESGQGNPAPLELGSILSERA